MAADDPFPADYEELPYPQEYDYLWTEERYTKYQEKSAGVLSPSWWFGRKDEAESRQGVASVSPLLAALVVGVAYSVLLVAGPLLNPPERPKLENDPLCGIPTGGQVLKHFGSEFVTTTFS